MTEKEMNEIVEKFNQLTKKQIEEILSKYVDKEPEPEYFHGQLIKSFNIKNGCISTNFWFELFGTETIQDKSIKPLSILDIWDSVYDRKWKWCACDINGSVYLYITKPTLNGNNWRRINRYWVSIGKLPSYMLVDGNYSAWRESLRKARHYKGDE